MRHSDKGTKEHVKTRKKGKNTNVTPEIKAQYGDNENETQRHWKRHNEHETMRHRNEAQRRSQLVWMTDRPLVTCFAIARSTPIFL